MSYVIRCLQSVFIWPYFLNSIGILASLYSLVSDIGRSFPAKCIHLTLIYKQFFFSF